MKKSTSTQWMTACLVVLLCGGLGLVAKTYLARGVEARSSAGDSKQASDAVPVALHVVRAGHGETSLTLPGNIEPLTEATVYARIDGYVRRRLVDIGDRVAEGDLLAEIESPETDQQLQEAEQSLKQARAALELSKAAVEQAKANLDLADITARRWRNLSAKGVVSRQEGDEREAAYRARKADLAAAEANQEAAQNGIGVSEARLRRMQELVSFEKVRAPFSGVITARNIDIGSLISAGSSSSVHELLRLARTDRLRVFVDVPQSDVEDVRPGVPCSISVRELPSRDFAARITRRADALDLGSRSMRVEIQVDNPGGDLFPGMYAQVRFQYARSGPTLLIPASTLIASGANDEVALVNNGVVHVRRIRVGRDYGANLEITGGIAPGDELVLNPDDRIRDGVRVRGIKEP